MKQNLALFPNSPINPVNQGVVLNCVADGVFTVDTQKRIQFFNRSAERITGFKAEEAIGKPCCEIFRPAICSNACTLEQVERTNKNIINQPVKIYNKSGDDVLVSVSAALLMDRVGHVIGGVETFRDLSTEEDLRKQIRKAFTFQDIISRHPKMTELFHTLPDIAISNVPVLIEGESGTGKELFARAIHNISKRKKKPFIAVNCGSLPDTLLESELFGYKKGAFTDAKKDKPGRFALARGGTLFLDEIGDVSAALQIRLLRVLQEKSYEPLGSVSSERADVRIIAATNQKLSDRMKAGAFREDLFYRLNVMPIQIPPLRERHCDIPLLIDHFRKRFNAEYGKSIESVCEDVMNTLVDHPFPGNVRELENIMQHAFVLCKEPVIQLRHLPKELWKEDAPMAFGRLTLKEIEKSAILECLERHGGNQTKTSNQLGIDPSTLYRKLKSYNRFK